MTNLLTAYLRDHGSFSCPVSRAKKIENQEIKELAQGIVSGYGGGDLAYWLDFPKVVLVIVYGQTYPQAGL